MKGREPWRPQEWKTQLSIGDVGFRHRLESHWPYEQLMGDDRIRMLRAFYRREALGVLVPCSLVLGEGLRELKWADVRWNTAGKWVTSDPEPKEKP